MVARSGTRVVLFLSSYSPLFLILAFRFWFADQRISVAFTIVAVSSLVVLGGYLRISGSVTPWRFTVEQVASKDSEMMSYVVTYLLPFLNFAIGNLVDTISLGMILAVVGILYVRGGTIHINPILNILGFHLYGVETGDHQKITLISKKDFLPIGSPVWAVRLDNYVVLERK